MVYGRSPPWTASSPPVTVPVWGVLQSDAVNVRLAGAEVPSAASLEATATATSAGGWLAGTTADVAGPHRPRAAPGGLAREHARKRRRPARLGPHQPRRGRGGDARGVVVGVRDRDVRGILPGIAGVRARRGGEHDRSEERRV